MCTDRAHHGKTSVWIVAESGKMARVNKLKRRRRRRRRAESLSVSKRGERGRKAVEGERDRCLVRVTEEEDTCVSYAEEVT